MNCIRCNHSKDLCDQRRPTGSYQVFTLLVLAPEVAAMFALFHVNAPPATTLPRRIKMLSTPFCYAGPSNNRIRLYLNSPQRA